MDSLLVGIGGSQPADGDGGSITTFARRVRFRIAAPGAHSPAVDPLQQCFRSDHHETPAPVMLPNVAEMREMNRPQHPESGSAGPLPLRM
jgi:hypothetical protein